MQGGLLASDWKSWYHLDRYDSFDVFLPIILLNRTGEGATRIRAQSMSFLGKDAGLQLLLLVRRRAE